jgi:hypothetical protein
MWQQVRKELDGLRAADGTFQELEIKRRKGNAGYGGHRPPGIEGEPQDGGVAALGPSAYPVRTLAYSTFVDKDDRAALFLGFFLRAGHCTCFQ